MKTRSGFTLVESLVGLAVTALLVTAILSIYTQSTRGYSRVQFKRITEQAVEDTLLEMETALKDAMYAEMQGTTLVLTFPKDSDAYGHPIPKKDKEDLSYRAGKQMAYYLSDASGNPSRSGTILWRGDVRSNGTVRRDTQWSLRSAASRQGRIAPITTFAPTVTIEQDGIYVTILVESRLAAQGETYRTRRQQTWSVGNANTWR